MAEELSERESQRNKSDMSESKSESESEKDSEEFSQMFNKWDWKVRSDSTGHPSTRFTSEWDDTMKHSVNEISDSDSDIE